MNSQTSYISLYDLLFLGTVFIGMTLAVLLGFAPKINKIANRFLSLAVVVMILWMARILSGDIRIGAFYLHLDYLPLQFSLAFGPLLYFYVRKLTQPDYKFGWKDLLHFAPALFEQVVWVSGVKLIPVLQLLAFISVAIYLYLSYRSIGHFYWQLKFNGGDRYRYQMRWLHHLLTCFGLLWLLWIPFTAVDYFYYHYRLGIDAYYPLYLLLGVLIIWMAATAYLRPEADVQKDAPLFLKPTLPTELKQKGIWLKKVVKENHYYQDTELSLRSLAEKLDMHPNELSRIINTALKKSFNDFINEYRVAEIMWKMQDPAFDHITLQGIAYGSGFNSKTTFHRIFKEMTGKSSLRNIKPG